MKKATKKTTWNDIKLGMRCAISGYLMRWGYEDRTKKNIDEIELSISRMFERARLEGMLVEYKTKVSAPNEKTNPIVVDVEFKTTPRAKSKIWNFKVG